MRLLEYGIYILILIHFLRLTQSFRIKLNSRFLIIGSMIVLALHIVVEHYRWQMIPAYLVLIVFSFYSSFHFSFFQRWKRWIRIVLRTLIIIVLLASFLIGFIFPVPALPKPSGEWNIGLTYQSFIIPETDSFLSTKNKERTIYLKVWYPTEKQGRTKQPYFEQPDSSCKILASTESLPAFLFSHLALAKTNGSLNLPLAQNKKFPVLLFSHGYGMWQSQNTSMMEALASNGYIVVSIGHPYFNVFDAINENRIIKYDTILELPEDSTAEKVFDAYFLEKNKNNLLPLAHKIDSLTKPTSNVLGLWVQNISAAIDYLILENNNKNSIFFNHIDIEKIGAFGHSFGGAASIDAAISDQRLKVVCNMDGWQFGRLISDTIDVPALYFEGIYNTQSYVSRYEPFFSHNKNVSYHVLFKTARHGDFSDAGILLPFLKYTDGLGKGNAYELNKNFNAVLLSFFNFYLMQKDTFDIKKFESKEMAVQQYKGAQH